MATLGEVEGLTPDDLAELGVRCLQASTYHLSLRPGPELVAVLGGLHAFMAWPRPVLADAGEPPAEPDWGLASGAASAVPGLASGPGRVGVGRTVRPACLVLRIEKELLHSERCP